jgi:hypothetical protein
MASKVVPDVSDGVLKGKESLANGREDSGTVWRKGAR